MATHYKRLRLEPDLIALARERSEKLPIYDYSHRAREANIVGCIGEVAFECFLAHFGVEFEDCRQGTEYDYLVGGYTVDVKTKDRTVRPRIEFDNSVPLYNHEHQRPAFYYFVSLERSAGSRLGVPQRFTAANMVGGIDIENLDRHGTRWEAGQTDPSNGTTFWTACMNVSMSQLLSNQEILRRFSARKPR